MSHDTFQIELDSYTEMERYALLDTQNVLEDRNYTLNTCS